MTAARHELPEHAAARLRTDDVQAALQPVPAVCTCPDRARRTRTGRTAKARRFDPGCVVHGPAARRHARRATQEADNDR